ncbi:LCP family protein, partial [Nocardia alni]|uniref:LCP family protein n=1 Tax=Nocardia alni TaxID=2815723 RepID=UPI001C23A7F8
DGDTEPTIPADISPAPPTIRPDPVDTPKPVGAPPRSWTPTMRCRRGRGWRIAGRSLTTLVAVVALVMTGVGWNYLRATDKGFTKVQALDTGSHDIVDPVDQLGDENFLIAGTDSRAGANGEVGAGTTADAEGARSDTVMLVNIPASRQRIVVVSFPRDLDVTRPSCAAWDNEKAEYTDVKWASAAGSKLNATYALGGPKCLTRVIQKLSGLKINHFIGLDFTGFESMVDTVGGVEVCTAKPIVDGQLGTILSDTGHQTISGATALNYVRARHVIGEERSDYDRIHRQQLFLSSLLRSALSNRVLFDPGKFTGFVNAFTGHAFMDNTDTRDLLMLGRSLQKMPAGEITFLTVPTAGTTSYGNEIPRETDIKAIFRAIIDDQPLPGEQRPPGPPPTSPAEPPHQLTATDPATVSVQVTNASTTTGLAGATAAKLAKPGFQIYSVDTYTYGTLSTTVVRYSSGHQRDAATVAAALPGAKLQVASGLGSVVQVALGTDFSGVVTAPPSFGTALPDIASMPAMQGDHDDPVTLPADLEHVNAADDSCE